MISILLPVYNEGKYIKDAISSIISQTYKDWELIVVDNGSSDNTIEICEELARSDSRIKVYSLIEKHKVKAHNYAFNKSKGEIICFFCGDDTLPKNSLEERVKNFIDKPSGLSFSTCLLKTFSENQKFDGNIFPRNPSLPNYSAGSIMFHRQIANQIFPIPEVLPNEDTWSQLHLRSFCTNFHVPKVLYNYRIHQNNSYGYGLSFTAKREKFLKRMYAYELFYEKYKNENNPFINNYLKNYVKAIQTLKKSKFPISILLIENIKFVEKLKFYMYSNKILFSIRNIFFKFFSGISN